MNLAVECPICGGQKFKSLFAKQEADVVQCSNCQGIYVPSPLPEMTSLYRSNYTISDEGGRWAGVSPESSTAQRATAVKRLQESEARLGGRGVLLDIGCAQGHLGKAAFDRGWDSFITDFSEFAVQKAATDYGLKAFVSPTGKLPVQDGCFDLVTMFNVVEHLSHPQELIGHVHRALRPKGLLHLSTPNVESLSARLMGRKWFHFKPDEHLVYFSPSTLQKMLESHDFEVLEIQPMAVFVSVADIFKRLRTYAKPFFDMCLRLCRWLNVDKKTLRVFTGQMEVWARPKHESQSRPVFPVEVEPTPLLGVSRCPNCESERLYPEGEEILCLSCNSAFAIEFGVINFSKYGKRTGKKVVGD